MKPLKGPLCQGFKYSSAPGFSLCCLLRAGEHTHVVENINYNAWRVVSKCATRGSIELCRRATWCLSAEGLVKSVFWGDVERFYFDLTNASSRYGGSMLFFWWQDYLSFFRYFIFRAEDSRKYRDRTAFNVGVYYFTPPCWLSNASASNCMRHDRLIGIRLMRSRWWTWELHCGGRMWRVSALIKMVTMWLLELFAWI